MGLIGVVKKCVPKSWKTTWLSTGVKFNIFIKKPVPRLFIDIFTWLINCLKNIGRRGLEQSSIKLALIRQPNNLTPENNTKKNICAGLIILLFFILLLFTALYVFSIILNNYEQCPWCKREVIVEREDESVPEGDENAVHTKCPQLMAYQRMEDYPRMKNTFSKIDNYTVTKDTHHTWECIPDLRDQLVSRKQQVLDTGKIICTSMYGLNSQNICYDDVRDVLMLNFYLTPENGCKKTTIQETTSFLEKSNTIEMTRYSCVNVWYLQQNGTKSHFLEKDGRRAHFFHQIFKFQKTGELYNIVLGK
jgi:hypothetical protein